MSFYRLSASVTFLVGINCCKFVKGSLWEIAKIFKFWLCMFLLVKGWQSSGVKAWAQIVMTASLPARKCREVWKEMRETVLWDKCLSGEQTWLELGHSLQERSGNPGSFRCWEAVPWSVPSPGSTKLGTARGRRWHLHPCNSGWNKDDVNLSISNYK